MVARERQTPRWRHIFRREKRGAPADGKVIAEFKPTGLRPKILDRIFAQGIPLPKEITMLFPPPPGYKPSARQPGSRGAAIASYTPAMKVVLHHTTDRLGQEVRENAESKLASLARQFGNAAADAED